MTRRRALVSWLGWADPGGPRGLEALYGLLRESAATALRSTVMQRRGEIAHVSKRTLGHLGVIPLAGRVRLCPIWDS